MKRRIIGFLCSLIFMTFAFAGLAYAGTWVEDENGWKYQKNDGDFLWDNWHVENGNWYYFGRDYYMWTDTWVPRGTWSYVGQDGIMLRNTITPDGYKVNEVGNWVNASGKEITATFEDNQRWHEKRIIGDAVITDNIVDTNETESEESHAPVKWNEIKKSDFPTLFGNSHDGTYDVQLAARTVDDMKRQLKDPDSLKVLSINAYVNEGNMGNGEWLSRRLMMVEYTATNSFGARVRNYYYSWYDTRPMYKSILAFSGLDTLNVSAIKNGIPVDINAVAVELGYSIN